MGQYATKTEVTPAATAAPTVTKTKTTTICPPGCKAVEGFGHVDQNWWIWLLIILVIIFIIYYFWMYRPAAVVVV